MNILVTGVGGGVGQGIIKCLKMIKDLDIKIIATDINEFATGLYAANTAYLVDKYDSDKYLEILINIFKTESIDFYIPGTDIELKFCSINKSFFKKEFNVHTVVSSENVIEICDDKFKTSFFLKKNGLNYLKTEYLNDIDIKSIQFPAILKPSIGYRSMGVTKLNSINDLAPYTKDPKKYVIQEYIGDEDTEYTCTVVKIRDELSPILALRRTLRSGDTYKAEPIKSENIEQYIWNVASNLEIDGGCNFQLRLDKDEKPKIFEINCRFSGTTPFCAQIGFNPLEFYLKKSLGLKYDTNIDYNSVILRYWSETVVKKNFLKHLSEKRTINKIKTDQSKLFS